jgi:hypothetical protein
MPNAPRKTIEVRAILDRMNAMIAANENADARAALCIATETLLFDAGQYGGFRYNDLFCDPVRVKDDNPRNMTRVQDVNRTYFMKKG